MVTVNMLSSRLLWWDDTWGTVNVPRYKTHDCTTQHTGLHTHCMFSVLMHVRIGAKKSKQQQTIQCRGLSHWYPHTHTAESPPLRLPALLFPFPALSFWHPSLSAAMDCETNFYHYTLQVKKGSWECVIYAGFDFLCSVYGLVHHCSARHPRPLGPWRDVVLAPLSITPRLPEPRARCAGGGMCCSCGTPSPPAPSASTHASVTVTPTVTAIRHLNGALRACVFVSGAFIPAWPLWVFFFWGTCAFINGRQPGNNCPDERENKVS